MIGTPLKISAVFLLSKRLTPVNIDDKILNVADER